MTWHERLGGRKYTVSVAGLLIVTVLGLRGAPTEAFIAVSTIVLSYCGGNAVVEWRHGVKPPKPEGAPDAAALAER